MYLSTYLSVYLSNYFCIYLSIYLSIYLYIARAAAAEWSGQVQEPAHRHLPERDERERHHDRHRDGSSSRSRSVCMWGAVLDAIDETAVGVVQVGYHPNSQ